MIVEDNNIRRSYFLGDNWLYYKIYTGHKTADEVLTNLIGPLVRKLESDGVITKWFFIRYSDPKFHLRVRFHCNSIDDIAIAIDSLALCFREYLDEDLIWKIQVDTYQRELERYGTNTIELAEEFFYQESKMIVNFLELIEGEEGNELRWLFSLRAIDSLLESFDYSINEKSNLLFRIGSAFRQEFGDSKYLRKQLSNKLRRERDKIDRFMVLDSKKSEFSPILKILKKKEDALADVINQIIEHRANKTLQVPFDDLITSYIHMLMNRLFKSNNRKYEMVCYDLLARYYKSNIARSRNKSVKDI